MRGQRRLALGFRRLARLLGLGDGLDHRPQFRLAVPQPRARRIDRTGYLGARLLGREIRLQAPLLAAQALDLLAQRRHFLLDGPVAPHRFRLALGHLVELALAVAGAGRRLANLLSCLAFQCGRTRDRCHECRLFPGQAGHRLGAVGLERVFAAEVGGNLRPRRFQPGDPLGHLPCFAFKAGLRQGQPLQPRRRVGLGEAQGGQLGREIGLLGRDPCLFAAEIGNQCVGLAQLLFGPAQPVRRIVPAAIQKLRIARADFRGKLAVAFGLAGLPLERNRLRFKLGQDIVETGQIGIGGAQLLLGFLAPAVQP